MRTSRGVVFVMASAFLLVLAHGSLALPRPGATAGGGGGPFFCFKEFDSRGIDQLARRLGVPSLPGFMRGAGGAGYAFFAHSRIGGLGAGASARTSALVGGQEHSLKVDYGYGGLLAEYISRRGRLTASAGCLLGGGAYSVEIEDESGKHKASKAFFCLEPCAGMRFQLVEFVALQAWAGYMLAASEDLSIRYGGALYSLTAQEMGGLSFRLGLMFGGQTP